MTVGIVVDSAAALSPELAREYGVGVAPLQLTIGSDDYADGELGLDELLDRLSEGVTTSAPTPAAWVTAVEALSDAVDGVLLLTVSSEMSASMQSATLAEQAIESEVRVVDSRTAAGAEALVAMAAAACARDGGSLDECEKTARRVIERVRLIATLDDLAPLAESGRVPAVAAWAGEHLNVKPLFEFRHGEAKALRPALSREAALDRIVSQCHSDRPSSSSRLHAAVLHARAPEAADRLRRELAAGDDDEVVSSGFSPVMVAHTGPGLAGLAWWWE